MPRELRIYHGIMNADTLQRRREKVLTAAARLFTSHDYDLVHMDAVAEAAEIAKPTLYRYFPTKEALFVAALQQTLGELVAEVAGLRRGQGTAESRLRRSIALVYDRMGCLAPALRAIESQGSDPTDLSRKTIRLGMTALRDEITALLDEGAENREFDAVDTELAAFAIVGAVRMTAMVGRGSGRSAKGLADLLLNGLGRRGACGAHAGPAAPALSLGALS